MRILLSNDDGYFAPGLAALAESLAGLGEIVVVAPERDRSGASNSLTLDRPLTVRRSANGFLFVNGTPTDCVHLAVTGLLEHLPDIVVSGINLGANMGDDTIYSGTVAAAMEGYQLGVPSIAFSLARRGQEHLATAARVARDLLARLTRWPLQGPLLLNVNVPACPLSELRGVQVTRLGRRHLAEPTVPARSPRGDVIYWIGPAGAAKEAGPGTDFHAVDNGWASITPLDIDLTAAYSLGQVRDWLHQQ